MKADVIGAVTASSVGTLVPGHTANTKGSYTQIVAATSSDCHAIVISLLCALTSYTATNLVDIAVGASGSEQIIIPDILVCSDQWDAYNGANLLLPVEIPAGSRIAARCAGSSTSQGISVVAQLMNEEGLIGKVVPGRKVATYGQVAASSRGTAIDPGATVNTKGAFTQLVATTDDDLQGFYLLFGNGGASKSGSGNALVDIAIGGAGAEQVILSNFPIGLDSNSEIWSPTVSPFFRLRIPAGSRISARAQSSINTAGTRTFDLTLTGVV